MECLANIGIEKEGEDGEFGRKDIFTLVASIMHLLNVGFQKGDSQHSGVFNQGLSCRPVDRYLKYSRSCDVLFPNPNPNPFRMAPVPVDGQEGDGCVIDERTRESLNIASELLGVDTDALEKAMVTKTMTVSEHQPVGLRVRLPLLLLFVVCCSWSVKLLQLNKKHLHLIYFDLYIT